MIRSCPLAHLLAGSAGGSGAVVRAAVPAVVEESTVPADEATPAAAIEHRLAALGDLGRPGHLYAGHSQGQLMVDVLAMHQAPADPLDVGCWPEYSRALAGMIGIRELGVFQIHADRLLQVLGHLATLFADPVDIVPIPVAWHVHVDAGAGL